MKTTIHTLCLLSLIACFSSCKDNLMDWSKDPNEGAATVNDIPLTLNEKLSLYKTFGDYNTSQVLMGSGIDLTSYVEDADYRNRVNSNYGSVTVGYDMKHGAMVKSDGKLNFTTVDHFITLLPSTMKLYGHTLVWHQNQNGDYLRSLIAPTIIPDPAGANLLNNGDFETGDISTFNLANVGDGIGISTEDHVSGTYSVKLISKSTSANPWDLQFQTPSIPVVSGHAYQISFYIRSVGTGSGRLSFSGMSNNYPWLNGSDRFTTSSSWTQVTYGADKSLTANGTSLTVSFDFGFTASMTYYLDDVVVTDLDAPALLSPRLGSTIDKTPAEKTHIVDSTMQSWITQMVGHYKNRVTAWDVINEPMADDGTLRLSNGDDSGDQFHWQDYLGKDYAVKAFKYARAAGNANDLLFINDYNLEYNTAKLDGLISYVQYIESQGVTVDGIGTQMHISLSSDTTAIDNMFKKLATTGKLIRVSELDVKVGTTTPSNDQLIQQAAMYHYVVSSYIKNIPAAQRQGITIWGITDKNSWIPNDAPCVWDGSLARKYAYKGICDALYGSDASTKWNYDDIINAR